MATMRNELAAVTLTAMSANTAKALAFNGGDGQSVLVINAAAATTLTVKAGNGLQGTADLTLSVPQGISLVKLESGRFKNVSGDNKGKIVLVSPGTPSVGVVALV